MLLRFRMPARTEMLLLWILRTRCVCVCVGGEELPALPSKIGKYASQHDAAATAWHFQEARGAGQCV